jgi:hypothetical protein
MSCVSIFMDRYTFSGKRNQCATRARPRCTTRHGRPCWCGQPSQVWPHLPRATSPVWVTSLPACITWMNKIDQRNVSLIEWMKLWSLGSMGPPLRPINRHNRHSKAILSVLGRRCFIPRHWGGPAAPRGLAAPPNRRADRNRLKSPTFNRLRSKDQERPNREAMGHRARRTSSSGCTYENGPTRSTDLTYL